MTIASLKRRYALFLVNHLYCGTRFFSRKRSLLRFAGFAVGEGTRIVGPVFCTGELRIGKDCWIGRNFSVDGNGTVSIGDNCDLGPNVSFETGGHEIGSPERRAGSGITFSQSVGNGTWIGANSTIIGNTRIGNSCVIGACACVNKDVPDHTLAGGVPAKRLRSL